MNKYQSPLQLLQMLAIVLFLLCVKAITLGLQSEAINMTNIRCIERERRALLMFKADLIDNYGFLSSWGSDEIKKDCCKWNGVRCSNRTGHVVMLDLHVEFDYPMLRGKINPSIVELRHLNYLDLSNNDFSGTIPNQIGNLSKLYHLDIGFSFGQLIVENVEWLSHLSSLNYLDMTYVDLSRTNSFVDIVTRLPSISHLILRSCQLSNVFSPSRPLVVTSTSNILHGPIPHAFGNMTSLIHLDLSQNEFEGVIPKTFSNLCNLQSLNLNGNNLIGNLTDFLHTFSCAEASLKSLNLFGNKFSGTLDSITRFSLLRELILTANRLNGVLPETLGQLSKLEVLRVASNSLQGVVSERHFLNLHRLKILDLSFNSFELELSPQWVPPFQLEVLCFASCKLGPRLPQWLQNQRNLSHIDLSSNKIGGTIPDLSKSSNLQEIDLSFNYFEGPVPLFSSSLSTLNLSENNFSGTLSFLCAIAGGHLTFLDLSHNFLLGVLPNCFVKFQLLVILNLGHNKLSGRIPGSMAYLFSLETLILRKNRFFGELPSVLRNCTRLTFLDLGENKLSGNIPAWIGEDLSNLSFLILGSNMFNGSIPLHICHLTNLQLLDLSMNNVSGTIPQCFYNFTTMAKKDGPYGKTYHLYFSVWTVGEYLSTSFPKYLDLALVDWKGKEYEFRANLDLLKVVDLSNNKLTGEFPVAITSLVGLRALNLSRNKLHGNIPSNIGHLQYLESLDLSRNKFSGQIPTSMSELSFLSYLDLSHNSLSGRIPLGTQMQSFEPSKYDGNSELCGSPLALNCYQPQVVDRISWNEDEEDFQRWFYIGLALGFIVGFWGICCTLLVNRRCRHVYFLHLDSLKDWIYVTMVVHMAKLQRVASRRRE